MANQKNQKQLLKKDFAFGSFKVVEDGKVSVAFDFSKAPIPSETYSASEVTLKHFPPHDYFLVFAQVDPIDQSFRHNLQIRIDDIALLNTWVNSREFYNRIGDWYRNTYKSAPQRNKLEVPKGTPGYQLSANLMFLGHKERSGVAAFYYFDPRAAREIALGKMPDKSLIGSPVVQVKLNTFLLWSLLDQMREHIDGLLTKFPVLSDRVPNDSVKTKEAHHANR